jgi:hypothetical protein
MWFRAPGRSQPKARHKLPRAISIRFYKRWCARASREGVRGPHGGYELAGEHRRISAEDMAKRADALK